jgi:single-strand DNA-binding protein
MPNYNRVILIGHVTRDATSKQVGDLRIANFGLATNKNVQKNGEWNSIPMFIDVDCFGKTAERAADFLKKGAAVLVEGELALDQWQDKVTGDRRSKHQIKADRVVNMGTKGTDEEAKPRKAAPVVPAEEDDPVPF